MLTREELEVIRATVQMLTAVAQADSKVSVKKISADALVLLDEAIYLELEHEEERKAGAFKDPLRQAEIQAEVRARLSCKCPPSVKRWRKDKTIGSRKAGRRQIVEAA